MIERKTNAQWHALHRSQCYKRSREQGLCSYSVNCPNPSSETSWECQQHREMRNSQNRACYSPEKTAVTNKKYRAKRREAGLCYHCPKPTGGAVRCEGCAAKHAKAQERRRMAADEGGAK